MASSILMFFPKPLFKLHFYAESFSISPLLKKRLVSKTFNYHIKKKGKQPIKLHKVKRKETMKSVPKLQFKTAILNFDHDMQHKSSTKPNKISQYIFSENAQK